MDYCITTRVTHYNSFGDTPGATSFLIVPPDKEDFDTSQTIQRADWVKGVLDPLAVHPDATGLSRKDLLVFIHGFDNSPPIVLQRHRRLQADLKVVGFTGGVVSFDWPSGSVALAYLEDREKAKQTAFALVRDCIALFARTQTGPDCNVNVHILAHSMGAYVLQEAFDDADDRNAIASLNWAVSQIAFIGGDIAASHLRSGNPETESIFRHCVRLTNYSNPFDEMLQISNVKRAGFDPRVGRIGLPVDAPSQAVNVGCGEYYQAVIADQDPKTIIGIKSHSWFIGDPVFTQDLALTLNGDLDRRAIRTRKPLPSGQFELMMPVARVASAAANPAPKSVSGKLWPWRT